MAVQMLYDRTFQSVAHAVAGRRYLPLRVQEQFFCGVGEFVVLRTHHHADRLLCISGKIDPAFGCAAGLSRLQLVAGLQRTRIRAAEAGARIHRQAAEDRLAINPALDRKVAERSAAGKAQRQGLAVRQRHRCIQCNRASCDFGIARCSGKRDANRALTRGESRAEGADLDRRGERRVTDQTIRRRERQPIHRAARRQAVALCAMASAVLDGARRANG
jgi:hypothetical protein